jgi:hypothetical protein
LFRCYSKPEKVGGGFAENMSTAAKGSAEWLAAEAEAKAAASKVTMSTVEDVERYSQRLLKGGHYYDGEVQGLIDKAGRWRPIDFQPVRQLPPTGTPEYAAAGAKHNDMIKLEADRLRAQALRNAAAKPP